MTSTGLPSQTVTATVTDDDTQVVVVSAATLTVAETSTGSFGVTLQYVPPGNVTVTLVSSDATAASVAPASLTFTPANYNTSQTVTVTGLDDADAVNDTATVTASTAGATSGVVSVTVTDNDVLGIETSVASVAFAEPSSATFGVRLTAQPTGNTTVTMSSSDAGAATVTASLVFTTANWNTYQTATVTGVADADADAENVTVTVASTGLASRFVTATITDDEVQSIVLTTTTVALGESGATTFGVRLNAEPQANVVVTVVSSDTGAATATPASLTFTSGNYATSQLVTVTGVADLDLVNETVIVTIASPGLPSRTVTATVMDDDTQSIVSSHTTRTVNEGSSATVTVRLAYQPAGNVTVSVSTTNSTYAGVSPTSLTFTSANYATTQSITISSASDDTNYVHNTATVTLSSAGLSSVPIAVTQQDNDLLNVSPSSISGLCPFDSGQITVKLNGTPFGSSLTVNVSSSNTGNVTASPSRTFTTANYATNQYMLANAVNPAGGSATVTISASGQTSRTVNVLTLNENAPVCGL